MSYPETFKESYQVTLSAEPEWIHVEIKGTANYENAKAIWRKILDFCNTHQCYKILGEQRTTNEMSTTDAWKHTEIFSELGINGKYKIAWVDLNPRSYQTTQFIRQALANRYLGYGKIFNDTEKAKSWLNS